MFTTSHQRREEERKKRKRHHISSLSGAEGGGKGLLEWDDASKEEGREGETGERRSRDEGRASLQLLWHRRPLLPLSLPPFLPSSLPPLLFFFTARLLSQRAKGGGKGRKRSQLHRGGEEGGRSKKKELLPSSIAPSSRISLLHKVKGRREGNLRRRGRTKAPSSSSFVGERDKGGKNWGEKRKEVRSWRNWEREGGRAF